MDVISEWPQNNFPCKKVFRGGCTKDKRVDTILLRMGLNFFIQISISKEVFWPPLTPQLPRRGRSKMTYMIKGRRESRDVGHFLLNIFRMKISWQMMKEKRKITVFKDIIFRRSSEWSQMNDHTINIENCCLILDKKTNHQ